jgi:hypothetical protein
MRVLSSSDAESLLSHFPRIRLSYEVSVHKKDETYINNCFIIPKGKRCIAWATEWKRQKIIAIIEIAPPPMQHQHQHQHKRHLYNNNNQSNYRKDNPFIEQFHKTNGWAPGQIYIYDVCYHESLSYGTVFSGTLFKLYKNQISVSSFCIQNIYVYKGQYVSTVRFSDYMKLCEEIFMKRELVQVSYTSNSLIFGLPVMCENDIDVDKVISTLPYPVYSIQYRCNHNILSARIHQKVLQNTTSYQQQKHTTPASTPAPTLHHSDNIVKCCPIASTTELLSKQLFIKPDDDMLTNIQAAFIIRPNVQNDIYELFVRSTVKSPQTKQSHDDEFVFHAFAHIPNYKTSVMMNNLFRTIKENQRLDSMEESDDECEFENIDQDKFVSLRTEYKMICKLNKKFCKWVPISIVDTSSSSGFGNGNIITDTQVKQHEIRYLPKKYNPTNRHYN